MSVIRTKRNSGFDNTFTGLISGIIIPVITFFIIYFILSDDLNLTEYFQHLVVREIQGHFISISVIPNLLIFFIFIWMNKMKAVRGVLLSTFLWAFLILAIKLF